MTKPIDIVATWPKTRRLGFYLDGLARAEVEGAVINFRVARCPKWDFGALLERPARCFMVHDGWVRGYNQILRAIWREAGEVRRAEGGFWPPGHYIVRDPIWYPLDDPLPMEGFQGWRWFDLAQARREQTGEAK